MGLMGIHNPNALQCYAGYTYCPWCGKEGQNEGTVVNHLKTTLQARSCVQLVFWLPNSDVGLSLLAWASKLSAMLCHLWIRSVQLTYLPDQEFTQGSKGSAIQPDPLPSRRPEGLMKKVLPASPPNPSFILQPCQHTAIFYSSCDQDFLRKMLLITAQAVFIKVHQNNNSKQLNKHG